MNLSSIDSSNQMRDIEPIFTSTEIQVIAGMRDQLTLARFAQKAEENGTKNIIKNVIKFETTVKQMFTEQGELNNEYRKKAETEASEAKVREALHQEEIRALTERVDQLTNALREANTTITTLQENHTALENRFNEHRHSYRKPKNRVIEKDDYTEISNK